MRIVSLLPSATESVCALGARAALVGRSHECDFPAGVEAVPALSSPRLDPTRPGREIHDRVEELVTRGLSIYEIDAARLRALRPDVILTQTLCEVCADSCRLAPRSPTGPARRRRSCRSRRSVSTTSSPTWRGSARRSAG
jgi:iron complex transport system substrate-binding protein